MMAVMYDIMQFQRCEKFETPRNQRVLMRIVITIKPCCHHILLSS